MNRNTFPIAKSVLAPDALAQHIVLQYQLKQVQCQLLTATMRDVYRVTTPQQRFMFFVYPTRHRTCEEILAEWQFVAFLAAHGIPVAPAYPATSGELVLPFDAPEGRRYGVLSMYLPGEILRRRSSPHTVAAYGTQIARIHVVADTLPVTLVRPVNNPRQIVQDALTAAERAIADRADVLTALYHARAVLLPHLAQLVPAAPSYGLIHGDVIRANAIVGPDATVSVIDFDLCGLGWRVYDIASYLFAICGTQDEVRLRTAFLDGYTRIRRLSQVERELLPLFEAVRAVFDIGIPASAINTWGRANIDAFLDGSLTQLNQCIDRLLSG